MKYKYQAPLQDYFEIFKDDLPEVVDLKLAELKPVVKEKAEVLLMAEESLNRPRHWFDKIMYRLWVYEPAKKMFETAYKELKRFYWLNKRLKGTNFKAGLTPQEFKEANPIWDTIESYVPINSRGFALCPFHKEKTASLKVYDDHWHCYGCNEGGDVITFLCKINNITIKELLN